MNIPKLNSFNPNFGKVRESAATLAKENVKSDPRKLDFVNRLIKGQENNDYFDITGKQQDTLTIYTVVSRDPHRAYNPESFYCLDDACYRAQFRKAQAVQSEMPC